jgi:uncharacterized protein
MFTEALAKLEDIVRERMSPIRGTAHSFEHVDRVTRIAAILAEKEKADMELVLVGALLHDIGRVVGEPHNETGAKLAIEILDEIGYPAEKRDRIAKIILRHRQSRMDDLETLEEEIVWDADKIDLIGATGVLRSFHWAGTMKIPFEDEIKWCREMGLSFYDSLHTKTAKEIAKNRHSEMVRLLSVLESELSLEDLRA